MIESANKRKVIMSQVVPKAIFERAFRHRVEMARKRVGEAKDVILFMLVDGIEKGTVTLLGYAIVTEETSGDADSGSILLKGKSICEYFDNAKLPDVLAKYERVAQGFLNDHGDLPALLKQKSSSARSHALPV